MRRQRCYLELLWPSQVIDFDDPRLERFCIGVLESTTFFGMMFGIGNPKKTNTGRRGFFKAFKKAFQAAAAKWELKKVKVAEGAKEEGFIEK
jgi:hypothetical protein